MNAPIRTGVVGLGGLGTRLAELTGRSQHGEVVAITEINDERRDEAGKALDVPPDGRFASYDEMLASTSLDAVIIATPHSLHYDQVVAALEDDCHVLCEKPLTVDLEHARDLVRRDEATDRVLMVGYQRHIEGPYLGARERMDAWSSPPTFLTAQITQDWIDRHRGTWRADPALSGGGHLYDTGSHLVDVILWTSGLEPVAVTASMDRWEEDDEIDVRATVGIEFENGGIASVSVSGDAPAVREHIRAWGDDGGIMIDGQGWNDRTLRTVDPDGAERYPPVRDAATSKVDAFFEAIVTGSTPPATAEHALAVTAVTEAAYEADETGQRVPIDLDR